MFLNRKEIDVNFRSNNLTLLEYMCDKEQKTTFGIELLLKDSRIKVNEGEQTPLYLALKNVECEEDYFYKVTQMLLSRKDIDVNINVSKNGFTTALSRLALLGYKSLRFCFVICFVLLA